MTTSPPPDLKPLYPPYLSAFNAHSWPLVSKYLSPSCHVTSKGALCATSAADMRPAYELDFARCEKHDVQIKEMEQIRRVKAEAGVDEEWKNGVEHGLKL